MWWIVIYTTVQNLVFSVPFEKEKKKPDWFLIWSKDLVINNYMLKNNITHKLFVSWNRMIYLENICLSSILLMLHSFTE